VAGPADGAPEWDGSTLSEGSAWLAYHDDSDGAVYFANTEDSATSWDFPPEGVRGWGDT
jgi:hypothetical protein